MLSKAKRWMGAYFWQLSGRKHRNRNEFYDGNGGLRILTFHQTRESEMRELQRIVDWCESNVPFATLDDVDSLFEGHWPHGSEDRVLLTFDDGFGGNFDAASWLAKRGISAIFFVVPSLLDRTVQEYLDYNQARGVSAFPFDTSLQTRGLSSDQVREMVSMGHRVGAHNFAHRDLGKLFQEEDFEYEISQAIDAVSSTTGKECRDFAFAFGQPENISDEAVRFLQTRDLRIYSCHRGLSCPGFTPTFLLRHSWEPFHPFAFTRTCIDGTADHYLADRTQFMIGRVGTLPRSIDPHVILEAGRP